MKIEKNLPKPVLANQRKPLPFYQKNVEELLSKIWPELSSGKDFIESLPFLKWEETDSSGISLSITLFCKYRLGAGSFFYDMIGRWLTPFKRLNIDLFFSSDFTLPGFSEEPFTIAELVIHFTEKAVFEEAKKSWKTLETEIKLGASSAYHASRILEFKSLSPDRKTAMIQEKIASLMQNRNEGFDRGIFSQMQKFLVNCRDDFKVNRDSHHISRIISILYLIQKTLDQKRKEAPNERHFVLKLLKTKLHFPSQDRQVLGVLVGLNLLGDYEVFEQEHLMNAISSYLPGVKVVENSFLMDRGIDKKGQTLYIEIEKESKQEFSLEEIQKLRKHLPEYLKGSIERLMHPIFMPRNEEEILKNIMSLSGQLKYVKDLPQVIISFDEQKQEELNFTVIFLRILKPKEEPAAKILERLPSQYKLRVDRTRKLGTLRRRYAKEAVVFRIAMPSANYLRRDRSIDLYKARQDVLSLLQSSFGEVRDYNGGMILKEAQVLNGLKASLGILGKKHELLLEKFFYSLFPVEMRSVLEVEPIKQFFLLFLQSIQKEKKGVLTHPKAYYKEESKRALALVFTDSLQLKKHLSESMASLQVPSYQLVSFSIDSQKVHGYLLLSDIKEKKNRFFQTIEKALRF